jgi:hypothetical protein
MAKWDRPSENIHLNKLRQKANGATDKNQTANLSNTTSTHCFLV